MSPESSATATWHLRLFGKPCVCGTDQKLDQFDTKRAVHLLARLALSHRRALTRAEAAELLWPDDYFDATRLRLRQELARLRRGLGAARTILDTDEEWVRLNDHELEIDVRRFEQLFQASRRESDAALREQYCLAATELSTEPFLLGHDEPWISAERSRLNEIRYALLVDRASLQAQRGDHHGALETAKLAVETDPLQEAGHLVVMQELGKLGHLSDALGQYQNLKRLLREELSESPSQEAERVANELRNPDYPAIEPRSLTSGLTFNVPAPTEPIYGRDKQLEHLCKLLNPQVTTHRIVSLTGPGGIGKTRLANEVAMMLLEDFKGRVSWVSLADISDASNIPLVIATALGLTLSPSADPMERICALLPKDPMLLVLDNLEQLIPEGIVHFRALAESRPHLRLLTTSRTALNLGGERAIIVGPLPLPQAGDSTEQPAMRVFLDPLLAEQGYKDPDEEELSLLRQITARLEGIPLALQLASARLRTMNAVDLLSQLDKRLDMVNRRADAPQRHRTIRAAIDGSYQALPPELQRIMGRLAVFRGGWTQAAAARVCELEDPLPALEALLDSSLIRVDREDKGLRFRMLETIRDYVQETIPENELLVARQKHADWIVEIMPLRNRRQLDADSLKYFNQIDPEIDNLREAYGFALREDLPRAVLIASRYGPYFATRSLIREAIALFEGIFGRMESLELSVDLARASFWHAQTLYIAQRFTSGDVGLPVSLRTQELCLKTNLSVEYALCFLHQSRTPFMERDYDASLTLVQDAERRLRELDSPQDLALAIQTIAMIRFYQGKVPEAIAGLEESLGLMGVSSAPFHQVQCAMMLSFMYLEIDKVEQAKESAYKGLELAESYGVRQFIPMIQEACGKVAVAEGNLELAARWFNASATSWEVFGNQYQYGDQLHLLGRVHLQKSEPEEALRLFASAANIWQSKGMMSVVPCTLTSAARAYLLLGRPALAARLLGAVKAIPTPTRDSELVTEVAYVASIEADLIADFGEEKVKQIFANPPDVEQALREAFP